MLLQVLLSEEFQPAMFTAVPFPIRHHRIGRRLFPPPCVLAGNVVVQQVLPKIVKIAIGCVAQSTDEFIRLAGFFVFFKSLGVG